MPQTKYRDVLTPTLWTADTHRIRGIRLWRFDPSEEQFHGHHLSNCHELLSTFWAASWRAASAPPLLRHILSVYPKSIPGVKRLGRQALRNHNIAASHWFTESRSTEIEKVAAARKTANEIIRNEKTDETNEAAGSAAATGGYAWRRNGHHNRSHRRALECGYKDGQTDYDRTQKLFHRTSKNPNFSMLKNS
jgi:hypothetical protein